MTIDLETDLTTARTAYREAQAAYAAYPGPLTCQAMEAALSWITDLERQQAKAIGAAPRKPRTKRASREAAETTRKLAHVNQQIDRMSEFIIKTGACRSDDWKRRVRLQLLRWMWIRAALKQETSHHA